MKINHLILLTFSLLFLPIISSGQSNYELLYLEGNNELILSQSEQKSSAEDYYWNALIMSKQGNVLKAIETMKEGISRFEGQQKHELLIADLYYEAGNFLNAKPFFEKYQHIPEVFLKLIRILEFQNNYCEAIKLLDQKIGEDSLNISFLTHLGDNYFQIDSFQIAINYYEKVFNLNPEDQVTAHKLASLFLKVKETERSIEICNEVLKTDSLNKKFIRIKGSASFNDKDFVTAKDCFSSLYAFGDSGIFILKNLGISEFHTNSFIESREHLLKAFEKTPDDFEVCFVLGKGYLNSRTPVKGLYYFDKVVSLMQPDSTIMVALYLEKQSIYRTIDMPEKALECYRQVYAYEPKPNYLFYMASIHQYDLDEPKKALDLYILFLEKLPPPVRIEDNPDLEGQITISLRSAAENSIISLKEKLFFEGKLKN